MLFETSGLVDNDLYSLSLSSPLWNNLLCAIFPSPYLNSMFIGPFSGLSIQRFVQLKEENQSVITA